MEAPLPSWTHVVLLILCHSFQGCALPPSCPIIQEEGIIEGVHSTALGTLEAFSKFCPPEIRHI